MKSLVSKSAHGFMAKQLLINRAGCFNLAVLTLTIKPPPLKEGVSAAEDATMLKWLGLLLGNKCCES